MPRSPRILLLPLLLLPLACSEDSTGPVDPHSLPIPIDIPSADERNFAELRDFTVVGYFDPPLSHPGDVRVELFLGERASGTPLRTVESHVDPTLGITLRSDLDFSYAQGMAWGPSGPISDEASMVMTPDLVAVPGGLLDPSNKLVVTHDYYAAVILGGVSKSFDSDYADADGAWEDLRAGLYTLRVTGLSGQLAGRTAVRRLEFGRTHAMLGRFSPAEHKDRLLDYASSRGLRTYIDFFPGFFSFDGYSYEIQGRWMPNNSVEVVNATAASLLDDVPSAQNDVLLYNISAGSATNRIEIGALARHGLIDSARTTFHYYELGEPSLRYVDSGSGTRVVSQSAIADFALSDRLELTRIETEAAGRPLSENEVDPADERARRLHGDFGAFIPWTDDELFVVLGVVSPIPTATHEGAQPSQHVLENAIATVEYSFHAQSANAPALHTESRAVGLDRIFGSSRATSVYEFEHEFDPAALSLPPGDYVLVLACRDSLDALVAGGSESLRIEVRSAPQ